MVSRKVPRTPPAGLRIDDDDLVAYDGTLIRIVRTVGPHTLPWNVLRGYGPLATMRWDPHPPPPEDRPFFAVGYAAADAATALAEVFQLGRLIDTARAAPNIVAWEPLRPLRLLDLRGSWALRAGAAHALSAAPRPVCRRWSQAIREARADIDGLWAPSTMTGRPVAVLFSPSADSFPTTPRLNLSLSHPEVALLVREIAAMIGYRVH